MSRIWTEDDDKTLIRMFAGREDQKETAAKLGRTLRAVSYRLRVLRDNGGFPLPKPGRRRNGVRLHEGARYLVSGPWGDSVCRFLRYEGGHALFRSIKGGFLLSFTREEVDSGMIRTYLRELDSAA